MYNNTIYNNQQEGIQIGDPWSITTNTIIKNNISYANVISNDIRINGEAPGLISSNNILDGTNPLFINAANLDFRLNSESPAINTGELLAEVTFDLDRNARPQGSAYDIGALEFNQSTIGLPKNVRILNVR